MGSEMPADGLSYRPVVTPSVGRFLIGCQGVRIALIDPTRLCSPATMRSTCMAAMYTAGRARVPSDCGHWFRIFLFIGDERADNPPCFDCCSTWTVDFKDDLLYTITLKGSFQGRKGPVGQGQRTILDLAFDFCHADDVTRRAERKASRHCEMPGAASCSRWRCGRSVEEVAVIALGVRLDMLPGQHRG